AAGEFSATINWGDGSTSAGSVSTNGAGFKVVGSHTYASAGSYAVTVSVTDVGGSTATAQGTAIVTGTGLVAQGKNVSATEGIPTDTAVVATFTDRSGTGSASQY